MRQVTLEETRKHVPKDAKGGVFVIRNPENFGAYILDIVEIVEKLTLQRIVLLCHKRITKEFLDDLTDRLTLLIRAGAEAQHKERNMAIEAFGDLSNREINELKRKWIAKNGDRA